MASYWKALQPLFSLPLGASLSALAAAGLQNGPIVSTLQVSCTAKNRAPQRSFQSFNRELTWGKRSRHTMVAFSGHREDGDELLGCCFSVPYIHVEERWQGKRGEDEFPLFIFSEGVAPFLSAFLGRVRTLQHPASTECLLDFWNFRKHNVCVLVLGRWRWHDYLHNIATPTKVNKFQSLTSFCPVPFHSNTECTSLVTFFLFCFEVFVQLGMKWIRIQVPLFFKKKRKAQQM